jgi:ABC-type multidrug transport system fused ATPase/permease subunit
LPDAIDHRILQGKIEFKDIVFGYSKGKPILRNITFSIAPTSKIVIVGPSGCGKTTLLSLMLRLYDVENGVILMDGMDIKKIKMKSLKEQIGIALQESFLWNDTVANNISYGAEGAGEDDIIRAAKIAEAHNFILGLPKQYDSVVGEDACKISEGQKQRIAIARALIKRPKIIILDEALSSVDMETEEKIIANMRLEFKDSTVIVVSHRPSTMSKMDTVYSLEDGSRIKAVTN